jgi:hypothetical protein
MGDAQSPVPGSPHPPHWFDDVLEAIDQFGLASIGLVAWELSLAEEDLVPAWRDAAILGLVERVGRCPYTREPMYRLAGAAAASTATFAGPRAVTTTPFLDTMPLNVATRLTAANAPPRERNETPQPI